MFVWLQALDLSPDLLTQREVVHVDIAVDGLSSGEKKPELVRRHFYGQLDTHIQSRVHGGEGRACNCQFITLSHHCKLWSSVEALET